MKQAAEFEAFDKTMRDLMNVSHDEIEKELDAEMGGNTPTKRKAKKPSASGHDADKID